MNLPDGWTRVEKALFIENHDTLVVSDFHFGRRYPQTPYPQMEYQHIKSRMQSILDKTNPQTLIINGDIFNEFPPDEESISILKNLKDRVNAFILIEGNHEEKVGGFPNTVDREFNTTKYYELGDILIHHGHHTPTQRAEHHVIGHLHPRYNGNHVFLHCNEGYYDASVTVTPAFSNIVTGVDVQKMKSNAHCPILADGVPIKEYTVMSSKM